MDFHIPQCHSRSGNSTARGWPGEEGCIGNATDATGMGHMAGGDMDIDMDTGMDTDMGMDMVMARGGPGTEAGIFETTGVKSQINAQRAGIERRGVRDMGYVFANDSEMMAGADERCLEEG